MLAECCPLDRGCNVPLMEKKKEQKIICVSCGNNFYRAPKNGSSTEFEMKLSTAPNTNANATNTGTATTVNNSASNLTVAPTRSATPAVVNSAATTDKVSESEPVETGYKKNEVTSQMGEKLLQGWTLLQESCPACSVPLMRDRDRKMWCFSCNLQVITQADFDPARHRVSWSTSEASSVVEGKILSEPTVTSFGYSNTSQHEAVQLSRITEKTDALMDDPVTDSIRTLYMKLRESQQLLQQSKPAKEGAQLCTFIRECAGALTALHKLEQARQCK